MLHAPALRHATSGLLSARVLLPIVLGNGSDVAHMSQALLQLAADLASRLLPAFNTATGIPYGEVNLRMTLLGRHSKCADVLNHRHSEPAARGAAGRDYSG